MSKKNSVIVGGLALCLAVGIWYFTPNRNTKSSTRQTSSISPVTTVNSVPASTQDVPIVLQASGTVVPLNSVELHAQTTSTIKKVHIKEGLFVHEGDLLFTLDNRTEQANVEKAQAQLAQNQASLTNLERQYKRSQELFAQKFISQSALDTVLSQVNAQRALLKSDAATVKSAQVAASYNSIHAPMTGRAGAINVFPGSLVQPATLLVTITQLDPISVSFTLPESSMQAVHDAQKSGPVPVQARLSNAEKSVTGALSFIDNAVDPQAGTLRVKAQFDNKDTSLWPGQYVNTRITIQTLKNAVVIPHAAILITSKGKSVYIVAPDDTAQSKPVEVLHTFGANAAVSGISSGEKIIVEGKQNLRPGGKVREAQADKRSNEPASKRG